MLRVGGPENVEKLDKADLRKDILRSAEEQLRAGLKRVQLAEEIAHYLNKLKALETKEVDREEAAIAELKETIAKCFASAGVTQEAQDTYYRNSEEEMCFADARSQRLNLILRMRAALGKVFTAQGLLLEAFYVLRQGLTNFKALAEGQYLGVEKGTESENKGSFKLPDQPSGTGAPAAGKKAPPPAKDAKGKPVPAEDPALLKREQEEKERRAAAEAGKLRAAVEASERRQHPQITLWLATKISIIQLLLAQKRFEDCEDAIAVTRLEAKSVRDQRYERMLREVEFQIKVQAGDLNEALVIAKEIISHAGKFNQSDASLCEFLGNLSELYYVHSKSSDAVGVVEQARNLTWKRLREYGLVVAAQDINDHGDVKVQEDRKKPSEEELEAKLASLPQAVPAGGKGAPAKGGKAPPAKGGAAAQTQEEPVIQDDSTEASLDFSKEIEYKLTAADPAANSSNQAPNLYLLGLESLVKLDLRYAQMLTMIQGDHSASKEVLETTALLAPRCLYISPQLKFYLNFLLGHVNCKLFYSKVLEFQSQFMTNPKYKDSFVKHVPSGSIALGHFLVELPNFSQKMKDEFRKYLDASEKAFLACAATAKAEALVMELDLTAVDALRGLAEVCFLQAEYRSRQLDYKYVQYKAQDQQRKLERLRR